MRGVSRKLSDICTLKLLETLDLRGLTQACSYSDRIPDQADHAYTNVCICIYVNLCVYNTYIYTYICTHIYTSLSLYVYIYVYTHTCVYTHIYIYIYIEREREREREKERERDRYIRCVGLCASLILLLLLSLSS